MVGPIWPDLINKMSEWMKIGLIYKNMLQRNRFDKSGRFSSSCYINIEIEPTNCSM